MSAHPLRPGRFRGPAILAAIVLTSGLFGPPGLKAADPAPLPVRDHEMFRQPTGAGRGVTPTAAIVLPPGFHETVMFNGLVAPTALAFAPDGHVFVAEKRGTIKVYDSLMDPTPTTYADLKTKVYDFWDRGLLGLAVDPNFATNGNIYALYTYNHILGDPSPAPKWHDANGNDVCPAPPAGPGAATDGCVASARLQRLHANASGVWDGLENVLIEGWCQVHPSHSIGTVAFGPDGALYAGAGDSAGFNQVDVGQDLDGANDITPDNPCGDPPSPVGTALSAPTAEGGALRAQDLRTSGDPAGLDGAIIRVDPLTGAAMPDNPLIADPDPNVRRVIAYGFRNPFRFTFRPGTSELWVGDVGWNTWEEFNRITGPTGSVKDFGWPCYESAAKQGGYDAANLTICENLYTAGTALGPYYTYRHFTDHVVAGDECPGAPGSVISGTAFYPPGGSAFPASYNGGFFFSDYARNCIWFMPAGAGGLPDASAVQPFESGASGPVDLKVGPDGALYYTSFSGGTVRRISNGPIARATAAPTFGAVPLHVQFNGAASTNPLGGALTYAWDLDGDGAFDDSTAANPSWTYTTPGSHTARLMVTGNGQWDIALVTVSSDARPVAKISAPTSSLTWSVGDPITLAGSATDAEDGVVPASRLSWTVLIKHCPSTCHDHTLQTLSGAGGTVTAPDHEYPSMLVIQLVATDSNGVTSAPVTVAIQPKTVYLPFATIPSGITLGVGSVSSVAPFTRRVILKSAVQVAAPMTVTIGGRLYYFKSWSDGWPATHTITARAGLPTLTATYGIRLRSRH